MRPLALAALMVSLLLPLFLLASFAVPPASATATPAVSAPSITSSALPVLFSNWTEAYTLTASVSVNWTCVRCYDATLTSGSPSPAAGFHVTLPYNDTSQPFSVEACASGAACTWQNWTATVYSSPVITSTPSFWETPGVNYTYVPTTANGEAPCSWSFSGAPYFTFEKATGALYASSPTNATYANTLNYSCANGYWAQTWYTVPSLYSSLPSQIAVSVDDVNVSLPTMDVAGTTRTMALVGEFPVFSVTERAVPLRVGWDGGTNYTASMTSGTGVWSLMSWFYGLPLTSGTVTWIGSGFTVSFPSSGYLFYELSANYQSGGGVGPPGGNGTSTPPPGGGGGGFHWPTVSWPAFSVGPALIVGLLVLVMGLAVVAIARGPTTRVGGLVLAAAGALVAFV